MRTSLERIFGRAPALAVCVCLCLSIVLAASTAGAAEELAVATTQANLRGGPGLQHPIRQVIRRGERVLPLEWSDGYVRVRRPQIDNAEGWLFAAAQGWTEAQVRKAMSSDSAGKAGAAERAKAREPAATAPEPEDLARNADRKIISLADIGFRRGHHFEGARAVHAQTFSFPLPREGTAGDASFFLSYLASSLVDARSTLRVDVNGRPMRLARFSGRDVPETLEITIPRRELQGRDALRVTVQASLLATEDRCFDERQLALHFVDVLPQSRLELRGAGGSVALRSAWALLPGTVRVSLGAPLTEDSARAAVQLAGMLTRKGKRLEFARLPEMGHVVVASAEQLAAALGAAGGWKRVGPEQSNLALLAGPEDRRTIAITHPAALRLVGLIDPDWHAVLRASGYAQEPSAADTRAAGEWVDLATLGAEPGTRYVSSTAEWNFRLAPPRIPGDRRIEALRVNLVATPEPGENRSLLYLHVNGVLQEIRELNNDGRPQTVTFGVASSAQASGDNSLRLVVQRVSGQMGDCRGPVNTFPVQLLPGSAVRLVRHDAPPEQFRDLSTTFANGLDVLLTPEIASRPERYLGLLGALIADPAIPLHGMSVRMHAANAAFKPARAFILFGTPAEGPADAPVKLDRGRVRVVDAQQKVLLDVDALPKITVAQLVRSEGQHGLWIAPAENGRIADPSAFALAQDNVAFADDDGVVMTLDARYRTLAHVEYPEYVSWFELLGRYRFWLIALGWTLLVVALMFLYRKAREHRRTK